MRDPPGDPTVITSRPSLSVTIIGDMELRGRFRGWTRLATGLPRTEGTSEKSVSSLLSRKPRTMSRDPKMFSIVVVIETALPLPSMMLKWLVDGSSRGLVATEFGRRIGSRRSRERLAHAPRRRDAAPAPVQISPVEKAVHGHVDEVRIRDVETPVGIGEPACLGDQMDRLGGTRFKPRQVEPFEQAEDLKGREPARGRRRHGADPPAAIGPAERFTRLGAIFGDIADRHGPGIDQGCLNRRRDVAGDRSAVERVRAVLGDASERRAEGGVLEHAAGLPRLAVCGEEIGPGRGKILEPLGDLDEAVQPGRNLEAVFGQFDGGAETASARAVFRAGDAPVRACEARPERRPTGRRPRHR